jgi:hypothetical protein
VYSQTVEVTLYLIETTPVIQGGDEDAKQHWFLCDAIWNAYKTTDDTQLVEFQMTLQGREL